MKGQRITVVVAPLSAYADNTVLPPYAEAELATVTNPQAAAEKRAGYGLLRAMGVEVRECTFDDIIEIDSYSDLKKLDNTYC